MTTHRTVILALSVVAIGNARAMDDGQKHLDTNAIIARFVSSSTLMRTRNTVKLLKQLINDADALLELNFVDVGDPEDSSRRIDIAQTKDSAQTLLANRHCVLTTPQK